MQEETEVLGENLRGQVWIENQIHIHTFTYIYLKNQKKFLVF